MTDLKLPEQRIATSVGTDTGGRAPNPNRQHFPTDLSLSLQLEVRKPRKLFALLVVSKVIKRR
jgi:hypothetical protein